MKKKFKILLTACLFLLAVCGAAVSVSAGAFIIIITVEPLW